MPDATILAPLLPAAAAAVAILALCAAVGHALLPASLRPARASHRLLAAASVGTTAVSWVTWIAGATLGTRAILPVLAAVLVFAIRRRHGLGGTVRRAGRHLAALARAGWPAAVVLAAGIVPLAVQLLLPPYDADGVRYHLALPKLYLLLGRVVFEPFGLGSTYPQNGEMLYLVGLLLANGQVAKLLHAAFFALALAALALAVHHGRRTRPAAALAALLLAASPTALVPAGAAFVDHIALFHLAVAVLLASRRGRPLLVGAALAGALATKITVAPAALAIGLWVLARSPRRTRAALALAAPAVIALAPLAARNLATTGDPIFPVGHVLVGRPVPGLNPDALRYTTAFAEGVAGPLGISWGPGLGEAPPDDIAGWHHLAGLLATAVAVRLPAARVFLMPVGAGLVTALVLRPPTRLLLPLLWGLAALEALALTAGRRRWPVALGLAAAVPSLALAVHALLATGAPLGVLRGREGREAFLTREVPGYAASVVVNAQPPGGRVMALDFPAPYWFDRPWIVEGMRCDPPLLLWLRGGDGADALLARLRSLDVRYVVVTPRYGGGSPRSLAMLGETPAQVRELLVLRERLRLLATRDGCDVYAVLP
jgi:hypothetical protein